MACVEEHNRARPVPAMLSKIPCPAIIAHRGASHLAPENTIAAFAAAVEQAADAIELDVMLTRNREVVVIHDDTVDRTTNGRGRVAELTLEDLQRLDAGSSFSPEFSDERIPTLTEVLETFAGTIPINIELKNYSTPLDDLPQRVARLIRDFDCGEQILFSSFNPLALLNVRRHLPEVSCGLLIVKGALNSPIMRILQVLIHHEALHPHYNDVTPAQVTRAHEKKRRMNTYTVNKKETMSALFEMGIDGIFTDNPALGLESRVAWRSSHS